MSHSIQNVVITGATSGIGLDLARRFLEEGSRVVLNARSAERLAGLQAELQGGDRVWTVAGDVGDPQTGAAIARVAEERFGGVDVLVNNAGIFAPKPFLESTEADLDGYFHTNVKGTFLVSQAIVPLMIKAGGGAIINLGTMLVDQGMTNLPVSAVMASKGGVHALTVSLAAELGRHGIRVNTLAPGIIRTPLIGGDADSFAGVFPVGRIGEVSESSDAVLYLARAGYVTGTLHLLDGGYSHARVTG